MYVSGPMRGQRENERDGWTAGKREETPLTADQSGVCAAAAATTTATTMATDTACLSLSRSLRANSASAAAAVRRLSFLSCCCCCHKLEQCHVSLLSPPLADQQSLPLAPDSGNSVILFSPLLQSIVQLFDD